MSLRANPHRSVIMRRWQRLNRSLERVSAVHDGHVGPEVSEQDLSGNDRAGITLHRVHDIVCTQDWGLARMTQLPPGHCLLLNTISKLPSHCLTRLFPGALTIEGPDITGSYAVVLSPLQALSLV